MIAETSIRAGKKKKKKKKKRRHPSSFVAFFAQCLECAFDLLKKTRVQLVFFGHLFRLRGGELEQGAHLVVEPIQGSYQGERVHLDPLGRLRFDGRLCGAFESFVAVPDQLATFLEPDTIFAVSRLVGEESKAKVDDRPLPLADLFRVETRQAGRIEAAVDQITGNVFSRVVDHRRCFRTFPARVGFNR